MTAVLKTPELVSSRRQARELVASLPADLAESEVVIDFSALLASTPSFLDELLNETLLRRNAGSLRTLGATPRVRQLLLELAENYGLAKRLAF